MKIYYNGLINATDAKKRMENARLNQDRTIWNEWKKGELYLKVTGFRMTTTFKVGFMEEYVVLKYSGLDGMMNIILCILWCGGFGTGGLAWLILSFITRTWDSEGIIAILVAGVPTMGILWMLLLKYRILARKYMNKVLGLNVKK